MALTTQEKHEIIYQLGWPGKTLIEGSTDYSKIVADRLANLNDAIEVIVRRLLARAKKLDEKLDEAVCRLSAKQVGDIHLNEDEILLLRKEKKAVLRELSDTVDVEMLRKGGIGVIV